MSKKTVPEKSKSSKVTSKYKLLVPNAFIKSLRNGRRYQMMKLAEDKKCTRQYTNFMLNKYLKTTADANGKITIINPNGCIHREGTRKWYIYTKV